ncbi:unnamed protein product [Ixodes hexagonus]
MYEEISNTQGLIYGLFAVASALILWSYYKRGTAGEQEKKRPAQQRYIRDEMPPVFPNGWIPVLLSSELKVNKVESLNVMGEELVAFRTQDGVARVMDAYCPHLGAHLGVMGRVVGDCIECPFHGWRFRGEDGACAHVPYASKHPEFVRAKTWISKEVYGLLLIWYHADSEEPTWDVIEREEISSGKWSPAGKIEKRIFAHMQDIAENGADIHHFGHIHKASAFVGPEEYARVAGDSWACRAMTFEYDIKWSEKGVKVCVSTDLRVKLLGWNALSYHIDVWQLGPALSVAEATSPFGNLFYVFSFTPHGPRDVRAVIQTYGDRSVLWPIRKFMENATSTMVDRDIIIWDHKTFLKNPALLKEDGAIKTFRKWYSQFYSSKSPTWRDVREKNLDW